MGMFDEIIHPTLLKNIGIINSYYQTKDTDRLLIRYNVGDEVSIDENAIYAYNSIGNLWIDVFFPVKNNRICEPNYAIVKYPKIIEKVFSKKSNYAVFDNSTGELVWYLGRLTFNDILHAIAGFGIFKVDTKIDDDNFIVVAGDDEYRIFPIKYIPPMIDEFGRTSLCEVFDSCDLVPNMLKNSKFVCRNMSYEGCMCIENRKKYIDYFIFYVGIILHESTLLVRKNLSPIYTKEPEKYTLLEEKFIGTK